MLYKLLYNTFLGRCWEPISKYGRVVALRDSAGSRDGKHIYLISQSKDPLGELSLEGTVVLVNL